MGKICKFFFLLIHIRLNIRIRILLPGGSSGFTAKYGYADVGYKIYKIAKEMNEGGNYFPIWGTCLGFELLTYVDADRKAHRVRCESESQSLPLEFLKGNYHFDFFSTKIHLIF